MKFKASLESGTKELELEFDIDDEAAAHARLTDAIAKLQKFGKKPERMAPKPADTSRATISAPAAPGGGK